MSIVTLPEIPERDPKSLQLLTVGNALAMSASALEHELDKHEETVLALGRATDGVTAAKLRGQIRQIGIAVVQLDSSIRALKAEILSLSINRPSTFTASNGKDQWVVRVNQHDVTCDRLKTVEEISGWNSYEWGRTA